MLVSVSYIVNTSWGQWFAAYEELVGPGIQRVSCCKNGIRIVGSHGKMECD